MNTRKNKLNKKRKRHRRLKNVLLTLVFIVGIALIFNQQITKYLLITKAKEYEKMNASNIQKEQLKNNKSSSVDSNSSIQASSANQSKGKENTSSQKNAYSDEDLNILNTLGNFKNSTDLVTEGMVVIPSINMSLPIFKGVTDEGLMIGATTLTSQQKMGTGNYSIASHNMEESGVLFSSLNQVKMREYIYLYDEDHKYIYSANDSGIIEPTAMNVIDNDTPKNEVTLITCENGGSTRYFLTGDLIEIVNFK